MANNIPPPTRQMPSAFLLAGRIPLAGQIPVASRSSPVFFLSKLENNHLDLCKREPAAKAGTSKQIKSKSDRSSFVRRRSRGLHMRRARSITRRRRLRELLRLFKERLWRRYTAMLLRKQYEIINRRRFSSRHRFLTLESDKEKVISSRPKEESKQGEGNPRRNAG